MVNIIRIRVCFLSGSKHCVTQHPCRLCNPALLSGYPNYLGQFLEGSISLENFAGGAILRIDWVYLESVLPMISISRNTHMFAGWWLNHFTVWPAFFCICPPLPTHNPWLTSSFGFIGSTTDSCEKCYIFMYCNDGLMMLNTSHC